MLRSSSARVPAAAAPQRCSSHGKARESASLTATYQLDSKPVSKVDNELIFKVAKNLQAPNTKETLGDT